MNTDDPKPEPESPSRIFEKSGHEVEDFDASLYKERWVDPNKHPKDLDNWGKVTSQEYRPDIRYLQVNTHIVLTFVKDLVTFERVILQIKRLSFLFH